MLDDHTPTGPTTLAGTDLMGRLRAALARRGLDHEPSTPIDNTPSPDEPGHPQYHHRQRVHAALVKLDAATPPLYEGAATDHPDVRAFADRVAGAPEKAGHLMLWGPTGTGKTHHAFGVARRVAESGPARFGFYATTFPDLYASLRPGAAPDLERERTMNRVLTVPLLLLDDLGTAKDSRWVEETTYRIVNHRYTHRLPTMITTNHAPAALPELVNDRIASRLIGMTKRIEMGGPDRRLQK